MIRELEEYLQEVTSKISNEKEALESRMELEDHILTKAELLCLSGTGEREAVLEVLSQMGEREELKEDLGEVHRIYLKKSRIVYENSTKQCARVAREISKELGMPCNELSEDLKLLDEEVLILVRKCYYGGKCSDELVRYIRNLDKKQVKMAVCINLELMFSRFSRAYYRDGFHYQNDYFSYQRGTQAARMLRAGGIEVIEEKSCTQDVFWFGRVKSMEINRIIIYLRKFLADQHRRL